MKNAKIIGRPTKAGKAARMTYAARHPYVAMPHDPITGAIIPIKPVPISAIPKAKPRLAEKAPLITRVHVIGKVPTPITPKAKTVA